MALGSVVLAYSLIVANDELPKKLTGKLSWLYGGGPEGARSVLSTIAGSVVTVAGTTFSITIAALTLASSQFGPRLLRTFRRDTGNQVVLGTFISTFLYCLLVLRTIVGTDKDQYVPDLAITFGVLLAVLSLAVLIYFIHHTAASIQASTLIDSVNRDLISTIRDNFAERTGLLKGERDRDDLDDKPPDEARVLEARHGGYLLRIDYEALVHYAARRDCRVFIHLRPGDFSLPDLPLASIVPANSSEDEKRTKLDDFFYFGSERTPEQDPEFAFLQLAEIGVRALSPGINDPFTAIACLDKLTESMALAAKRRLTSRFLFDKENALRVIATRVDYETLVIAAFQYIRKAASGNREVLSHLAKQLKLLLQRVNDPDLREALEEQLRQTREGILKCEL